MCIYIYILYVDYGSTTGSAMVKAFGLFSGMTAIPLALQTAPSWLAPFLAHRL